MKILVAVKRVPDTTVKLKLKPDGAGVVTDGVNFEVNPFDVIAVEEALRLKEKAGGGEVIVATIGSKEATQQLRHGLAMGADRGILVVNDDDNAIDADVVARTLKAVVAKEQPDIVLLGKQSPDGETTQVPQMLAEFLGWPQATFASKVVVAADNASAEVTREVDGGLEVVSVRLPAVISADLRLNEPRYASLPGIMKAKAKKIDELTFEALGVAKAPKVTTTTFFAPPERKAGAVVATVDELVQKLKNEAKVLG
jgi:electron transfer flavoprotein beta subunit